MVVGASDRGKSTYCDFLVRALSGMGMSVGFVDADPGQKDVGPPATIALARGEADRGLSALAIASLHFVGSVSPIGHFPHLLIGTRSLVEEAGTAVTVVDTTGLVHGPGRVLKGLQFESLRPDLVVAIERRRELTDLLTPFRHLDIVRLPASPQARKRSATERRQAREAGFRAYFQGASERELPLDGLGFQRTLLFSGRPLPSGSAIWAEALPEGRLVVGDGPAESARWHLPVGFEADVLCGVLDRRQRCLGLGLIQAIDFAARRLRLVTPITARRIRVLQVGELRVQRDGRHAALPRERRFPH